jgi:hypothetical protein
MLSPRGIAILLRHFDAIDEAVSRRMVRKRPWTEEALTGLLCDLLDGDTQIEENVSYTLKQVHEDFAKSDEPLSIRFRIETRQYPKHLERWVTQSDLGLIINYQNQFAPAHSTRRAWLLQAKRVFPMADDNYEVDSEFKSTDAAQTERMKALRDWAGTDFIRFLLGKHSIKCARTLSAAKYSITRSGFNCVMICYRRIQRQQPDCLLLISTPCQRRLGRLMQVSSINQRRSPGSSFNTYPGMDIFFTGAGFKGARPTIPMAVIREPKISSG